MPHKKNEKVEVYKSTIMQQINEAKVSVTTRLVGNSTGSPDNGNQVDLKVIIQQQQVAIDKLLERIVKLKECVT